jgi:hypothetical protein
MSTDGAAPSSERTSCAVEPNEITALRELKCRPTPTSAFT